MQNYLSTILILQALFLTGIAVWYGFHFFKKQHIHRTLHLVTFLVSLPKEAPKEGESEAKREEKDIISVMEQFYSSLLIAKEKSWYKRIRYGKPVVSLELAAYSNEIFFYVTVPDRFEEITEKQIHGFFPKASVEHVDDYNIFHPDGVQTCCYMKLRKKTFVPIKTYKHLEADPLNDVSNALSKVEKDEGAAIQLVIRPAVNTEGFIFRSWRKKAKDTAREIAKGKSLGTALSASPFKSFFGATWNAISGGTKDAFQSKEKRDEEKADEERRKRELESQRATPGSDEIVKSLEEKASKVGFETNIRLITSAPTKERADFLLEHLQGAFNQFFDPNLNEFYPKKANKRALLFNFIFRKFSRWYCIILNTEELTSIFHFPIFSTETPKIHFVRAKAAHPPSNIPKDGLTLGYNDYRGEKTVVRIASEDRARHMYIIGQTGTGKSNFLKYMILQDIKRGEGVGVVDPHGELVEDILECVPKERAEEVIYFDPSDMERPIGLNMLEFHTEAQKDIAIQEMISIFYKLVPNPDMIGPMFEHNMRNVMLTLMADTEHPGTLVEIPRMFTDEDYQKFKSKKVTDPTVKAFWDKEMASTTDFHKSEMLGYLISKVGRFVENEMIRNIIGQTKSGFSFREVMDKGKILLVNLSKGKIGEINSSLLGMIIVSKLQMAALARADIHSEERKNYYLYLDEFQNVTTDSIQVILSEARKYKLNLIIAHQFIKQLDEKIRDAVFGNVGTQVSLRIGAEDGEFMEKQYAPIFTARDLINLDNFRGYIKLMIHNNVSKPFDINFYPAESGDSKMKESLIQMSRMKYGKERKIVSDDIFERSKLAEMNVKTDEHLGPRF